MRKKVLTAGSMIFLGALTYFASAQYTPRFPSDVPAAASAEPETAAETVPETETAVPVTEPETEAGRAASPEELNLWYLFPEGEDPSDSSKSYAAQIFETLSRHDESWVSSVYSYADNTPAQMAERLGRGRSAYTGKYNPEDSAQDPDDPSTWTIKTFRDIRMRVTDGDGKPVTLSSNVIDIMSLANVYTYYHGVTDPGLFLDFAQSLWENSHSYSVSMSDVYYCSGCLDNEDEQQLLEELAQDGDVDPVQTVPETADPAEETAERAEEETGSRVIVSGRGAAETTGTPEPERSGDENGSAESAEEPSAEETPEVLTEESSVSSVVVMSGSTESETAESLTAAAPGGDDGTLAADPEETGALETASSSDASANSASENKSAGQTEKKRKTSSVSHRCPGHVDLVVSMKVLNLDGDKNLFTADYYGNRQEILGVNGWEGWTEQNRAFARSLADRDWYADYGLTLSLLTTGTSLTASEIDAYMDSLPDDLSETRKEIVRFALSSVGKVPYYWGGKASRPGYEGNRFGELVGADYKGRVLKGLDCSGWVNWVYWSVTGERLPYESTLGLAVLGTKIGRGDLLPGDIILRTGDNAHVIMFLEWTEDGRIRCVHESSDGVNNVTISERSANWPYYRRLID